MPKTIINQTGTWRTAKEIYVNQAGTWRQGKELWLKHNGVWRQIFKRALQLSIDADTTDYDLFTAAGSPTVPIDIVLTVGLTVVVGSSATSSPAIGGSVLPTGSTLLIINKGTIVGCGGKGGDFIPSSTYIGNANQGLPGGVAIALLASTVIDNNTGLIGGGGGGGTSECTGKWLNIPVPVPAGGGGAGMAIGLPGAPLVGDGYAYYSDPGTLRRGGAGAATVFAGGGNGGDLGSPGKKATGDGGVTTGTVGGGAAGRAVERNGFALSFTGGETSDQLKGAYD